ncbi:AAA family ATPase [Photobacterium damselae]|uniref:AAA family ATPase n=1 Tax=Photobacterium damselae TaxID=38293 RepID=UPI002542EB10|nr:AAA family ATPase [Photobacterium damselae]WIH19306.1 AAA family ATPase [Photobacterium damselae]
MPIATKICKLINSKGKPAWWRYVLNQAIELGELTNNELETAYSIAKMEFGLEAIGADYEQLTIEAKATGYHAEVEENKLLSVGNAQYVSTLAPEKKLTFSSTGLTVIYGNNGAGKSSYAKILKNACLTRGEAPEIRHNIFTGNVGVPIAEIEIESNGKTEIVPWSLRSEADSRLKSIRVFDSQSSIHYLAKSENLDYKPAALKLLDELLKASSYIAEKAKREELQYSANNVLPQMNFGTSPSKLQITSELKPEYVDSLCATAEEISELKELRKDVVELTNNSPQTLKERYQKRRARALPLQRFFTSLVDNLSSKSIEQYKGIYLKKESTKSAALRLSKETFSELPVENIGSEDWLAMWQAAKTFIQSMEQPKSFPPKEGESCPTCLQKVDASTASRLVSFDDYLRSSLQKDADTATKAWDEALRKVNGLTLSTAPYDAILNEIKEKDEVLGKQFDSLIQQLSSRVTALLKDVPEFIEDELKIDALTKLNALIAKLEEAEKDVLDDEQKAAAIKLKQQRIFEIEDKEKITTVRQQIKDEIDKAKKRDAYDKVKRSTSTSALTRLNNEICSSGSIGRMQEFFNKELAKLGFNHFKLTALTKGAKGNQKYSIQLPDNKANIVDIASEGEQKCISLAGFFAELNTDNRKSAIIFDDPVNSLDHVWRLKFARRIVEESESRQVIVFTHDLPFMKMIQEASDKVTIKAVTRSKSVTGIPLDTPPWDALKTNSRIGILKDNAVRARKAADESFDDYQSQAGIIYGKMRETWERLIEEWLIRGVVERFNREVKTQSCRYLVDIDELDIETINSAMGKCSTYMHGHDMSEEAAGVFPDIDELDQDIASLEQYFTSLKKRRT